MYSEIDLGTHHSSSNILCGSYFPAFDNVNGIPQAAYPETVGIVYSQNLFFLC
jgi:hypothetical protein